MFSRRRLLWLVLLAAAVGVVLSVRLFIWPSTDHVRRVDAVVLFAGGQGERLQLAERLMDDGVARALVIPNGMAPEWPHGIRACTERRSYTVHCPQPDPDTTKGEARAIAALAEQHGWHSVLVVTSSFHVSRASLLLARCFDGDVLTVAAQPDLGPLAWVGRLAHEWLAWSRAVVVDRNC